MSETVFRISVGGAFLLAFLLITWVNHGSDYEPAGAQLEADI